MNMFKKNNIPWNKGKKTGIIPKTAFKKGHQAPPTAFQVGSVPWNKGINTGIKPWLGKKVNILRCENCQAFVGNQSHVCKEIWNKGIIWEEMKGDNHPQWKADNVGYFALHGWIQRTLGKASKCVNGHKARIYHWANISGEYKRDLSDWHELCPSCNRTDNIRIHERFGNI